MKQRQIRVCWQWSIPFTIKNEDGDVTGIDKPVKYKRFHSYMKAQQFIDWLMDTESENCPKLNGKWVNSEGEEQVYVGDPAPKPDYAYIETRLVEYPKWEKM